jgi:T-complex protein 1 subunit zeta
MERIVLACGGNAVNSVEGLSADDLGYADEVYEVPLG